MDNWDFLDEDFEKEVFEDNFTVIIIYDIISQRDKYVYSYNFCCCVSFIYGFLVYSSGKKVF